MNIQSWVAVVRLSTFRVLTYGVIAYYAITGTVIGCRFGKETLLKYLTRYWRMTYRLLRYCGGVRMELSGISFNPYRPILYLPTHESALDALVFHVCGRPAYVAKQPLFSIPFFGYCMKKSEMIPINHTAPNTLRLARDVARAFDDYRQVIFFPEGARTSPNNHTVVQSGTALVVRLAHARGIPVVPVVLATWDVWHPSGGTESVVCVVRACAPLALDGVVTLPLKQQRQAIAALIRTAWQA